MGLAVFLSHARAAVSSDAHHTTYHPLPPKKRSQGKKQKKRQPWMHCRCTRGAQSLGMTGCSDELGEPEFGLQLGLVDVNAVLLRIYCYSLLSTLAVTLKLCMLTILQQLSSAEAQQSSSLLLLVHCDTPASFFVCILHYVRVSWRLTLVIPTTDGNAQGC